MPDEFFQNMDFKEKLLFCCQNGNAASFAYDQLLEDFESAELQMSRIWSYATSMQKAEEPTPNDLNYQEKVQEDFKAEAAKNRRLFIDMHFYFISWGNVRSMMAVLSKQPEFKEANFFFNSQRKIIEHYVHARNTFEHFDQRLPGGTNHSRVKEVQAPGAGPRKIFRGISKDGCYLHSDKRWDIKPSSLEVLRNIVNEFISKIHVEIDLLCTQKFEKPL